MLIILIQTILVLLITLLTALIAPPNTWDSMTYHMPRVMHWIQNGSLAFYPTVIERQLYISPFSEYVICFLQLLTGTDRFANLVQYFSMLGCMWGSWQILKHFQCNRLSRMFASFLIVTIPMGIMQAASTQTDYVSAFWTTLFYLMLIKLRKKWCWKFIILAGLSFGLGALTKGTAYIYCGSILLVWIFFSHKILSIKKVLLLVTVIGVSIGCINGFHYANNYRLGGHILKPTKESASVENADKTLLALVSNMIRNVSLNLATGNQTIDASLEKGIAWLHQKLGIDVNDPRTSYSQFRVLRIESEDLSNNLRHFILFVLAVVILMVSSKVKKDAHFWEVLCIVLLSFVVFSYSLKWQATGVRFMMSMFILTSIFTAGILGRIWREKWIVGLTIIFFLCSYTWLFKNQTRRLISTKKTTLFNTSRAKLYFANREELYEPYQNAVSLLERSDCRKVGLQMGGDSWEYPLWALLPNFARSYRIEHINFEDMILKEFPLSDFVPCAVFSDRDPSDGVFVYNNQKFSRVYHHLNISLYFRSYD